MGVCGSIWRWSLRGHTGVVWAWVGALLLGHSLAQPPPTLELCPSGQTPLALTQPHYQTTTELDPGAGFMSGFVQSFLHTVQPNPFPTDLLVQAVEDINTFSNPETIKEVLLYEVGFLVCIAIGFLYTGLTPLVGLLLAFCRCCGNCGGYMYQNQKSNIHCRRRALWCCTLITTLIILAGNICMFRSNQSLKVNLEEITVDVNNTLTNLQTYITAVPQQLDRVLTESYKTVDEVTNSLDNIGPKLGSAIQRGLEGHLLPALDAVREMAQVVNLTGVYLVVLNSSLSRLQPVEDTLLANISDVKDRTNRTLSLPTCLGCGPLQNELPTLLLDTTLSIPNLSDLQSAVDQATIADLNSKVTEGQLFFDTIPERVTTDAEDAVQSVKTQLVDIKNQLSQVTGDIPLTALNNISHSLEEVQVFVNELNPEVETAEEISWIIGIIICCAVLLVVVCNMLGLLLGPVGLRPNANPTERSCTSNCGGTFFMIGAGWSFLFSWLLMLLVTVLFVLGGNVYSLVCQPWESGELLQIVDTPGVIPGFNLGEILGLKTDLKVTDVYRDCEKDSSLWTTLHLYELIDLNDLLNVSKYTADIQQQFESSNISLSTITLLTPEIRNQLNNISDMAQNIDLSPATRQINNISSINLNETADKLDQLANHQPDPTVQTELRNEARDLREIQSDIETTLIPQLVEINSTIETLSSLTSHISEKVGEVLSKVGTAQAFLNSNTTQIIKSESREFLDCQMAYFTAYADWANLTITQQVGRCGPVVGALDSAEVTICLHMIESLNAFWFSLGWCLIFLLPSTIFSMKLAKYYRRMKHSDVYDNHIAMNHIPRAQMKPY